MAKTRSMTRNQNHVNTPTKKRSKSTTIDKGYSSPWSDLNHDVLFLVMMQLGVVEFIAFSGVCKSWRAVAQSNKETFMASRQPMLIWISDRRYKECFLKDSEGRKYKTLLPHSGGRECVGITCGYLVLFGKKTCDFWLMNPITRNGLHFPAFPFVSYLCPPLFRAILVSSPIISKVVLVMVDGRRHEVWFSIEGMGSWNHVSCTFLPRDLLVFKGKIYVIDITGNRSCLYEVRLHPEPKLVLLLETKKFLGSSMAFFSCGENLYAVESYLLLSDFRELDFGQKKWVRCEKIKGEYAFFMHGLGIRRITAIKPESWAEPQPQYRVGSWNNAIEKGDIDTMWYFPHECLNVTLIDG